MTTQPTSKLLIVSLGINRILIGLFAGILIKQTTGPTARAPSPGLERMTAEERRFTRQFFQQAFTATTPERDAHAQTRSVLHDTITSDGFDVDQVGILLQQTHDAEAKLRIALNEHLLSKLPDMTEAERARIARRLFSRRGEQSRREPSGRGGARRRGPSPNRP